MVRDCPGYTGRQIADAKAGDLWPRDAEGSAGGVVTDSREVAEGDLFVALRGEISDGHRYLESATEAGARGCVIRRSVLEDEPERLARIAAQTGAFFVIVNDPLEGLHLLATHHLRQMTGLTSVGITGSNGKTTTKELVASILGRVTPTVANEGNLNSETGLPLSCFRVTCEHRVAIFEMGMNHLGEIAALTEIVRPAAALITNIGTAHIGFCGSQDAIAQEKKSIFSTFNGDQTAFIPRFDPYYAVLAEGLRGRVVGFGEGATRGFTGSESLGLDGSIIHWEGLRIRFPLVGLHNVRNALAAISVAVEFGAGRDDVCRGLEEILPVHDRVEVLRDRTTVIADCYNSSPESVSALLELLRDLDWQGRAVGVFGSMLELGESSERFHREMARQVLRLPFAVVCFFGVEAEVCREEAGKIPHSAELFWTADHTQLRNRLRTVVEDGDLIVLKGSRGVELERHIRSSLRGEDG